MEKQDSEIVQLTRMMESDEDAKKVIAQIGSQFDTGYVAEQMLEV